MSKCPDLIHELSDYLDGEASPEICAEIERHLEDCPDCKVMVNTLEKTIILYREREDAIGLPEDVRHRLHLALNLGDGR